MNEPPAKKPTPMLAVHELVNALLRFVEASTDFGKRNFGAFRYNVTFIRVVRKIRKTYEN